MMIKIFSFEVKLFAGFIFAMVLLITSSIISFYYNKQHQDEIYWVNHTHMILHEAEKTISVVKDFESGSRGYVITGDSSYLEHFGPAETSVNIYLKNLKILVADNPLQLKRLDKLQYLIFKRIEFSKKSIELRYKKGFRAAEELISTRQGKNYMDSIRLLIRRFEGEEDELLARRNKESRESLSLANIFFTACLICSLFLLVIVLFFLRYHFNKIRFAEQEARDNEKQIETMLEAAPDAVIVIDEDGRIVKWNSKAETIFGWEKNEVLGKMLSETIIPVEFRAAHQKGLIHFLRTGQGAILDKTVEMVALNKEEKKFDVSLSIASTKIKNKYFFIGFVRDITSIKKAEEKFRELLDAAPDAMVIVNEEGEIVLINQQTELVFGYKKEELIHKKVEILIPGEFKIKHIGHRTTFFRNPKTRSMGSGLELYALRKNGTQFPVEISLSPLQTEEETLVSASIRDITDRKEKSIQLQQINKELESFSYSVSHDLRAPLRAINSYAAMLQELPSNEEYQKLITRILVNAKVMGNLIDDLLTFSRLGKKELSEFLINMEEVVAECVTECLEEYNNKGLKYDIKILSLPTCQGDPAMIKQVWINLINNALKYTSRTKNPEIEIGFKNGNYYVCDNGTGFDMTFAGKLFGVFERLHRSEEFEGSGIGLALVKRIIDKHKGKVYGFGEVGKGATFSFWLPKINN